MGEDIAMAFNPSFLQEGQGMGAINEAYVRLSFVHPTKPAVLTAQAELEGEDRDDFRLVAHADPRLRRLIRGGKHSVRSVVNL